MRRWLALAALVPTVALGASMAGDRATAVLMFSVVIPPAFVVDARGVARATDSRLAPRHARVRAVVTLH